MILQEVRGECIASGVSVILAFVGRPMSAIKQDDVMQDVIKTKAFLLMLLIG